MKLKITKPVRVNALSGTVEVDVNEAARLFLLGAAEPVLEKESKEIPEKQTRTTRKK